jgi:polyisoprenoid-binding protein YceI
MKSRKMLGLVMAMSIIFSTPLMAADYVIDSKGQHASVFFKADHLGYSYVIGRFNDFEGSFSHDAGNPSASKASLTINAKSVDTNHAERDKHLRSEDFLEVSKYPTITFVSTGYATASSGDKLEGNLTIHGVTKAITIDVKHIGEGPDPWNGYRSGFEGNVTLKASDYGMPDWLGNIEISLIAEGIRQ